MNLYESLFSEIDTEINRREEDQKKKQEENAGTFDFDGPAWRARHIFIRAQGYGKRMNSVKLPELSRTQRKKLAAEMHNKRRNELVRVTCPACKNRVSVDVKDARHERHLTIVTCPNCRKEIQLARWIR